MVWLGQITQGGGSCGFFKWCDDQQTRVGAPPQASPLYQTDAMSSIQNSGKGSSSSCFKCGQENHWARDCPNQSSDPYPDKGGRTLASASSPDGCFKCGKTGHWSRDCPTSNSGGGTGASRAKSSSALGSWNSQRYWWQAPVNSIELTWTCCTKLGQMLPDTCCLGMWSCRCLLLLYVM